MDPFTSRESPVERLGGTRASFTFSVDLLDFHHLLVVSGTDDLDESLLVCSEALKQQKTVSR